MHKKNLKNGLFLTHLTCLNKKALDYQGFFLSERRDSNSRPSRWQRDALPAELLSLNEIQAGKITALHLI